MHFDTAEGTVYRPPGEADSLIIRVTIGCSHNSCTFCGMYREVKFRVRSMDEITAQIKLAASNQPNLRRVFLADGNALVLPTAKLLEIINLLRKYFPRLSRVTCYGGPKDILRKSLSELTALKQAGLKIIYLGLESGDEEVLLEVNKGVSSIEMVEAGRRVMATGIKLSLMVILGLGGKKLTRAHAFNTALAINEINPSMLSTLTLMLQGDIPLALAAKQGKFHPLSALEIMQELELMIREIKLLKPCIFRSSHISNLLPLAGTLPKDKDLLLSEINEMVDYLLSKNHTTQI